MLDIEPQPRLDTLVRRIDGTDVRRTEYAGAVWLDGKPQLAGMSLRRPPGMPIGVRSTVFSVTFFLPDSLPYLRTAVNDSTLSIAADLRASGESGVITDAAVAFADDPSGVPTWLQVRLAGSLSWPAAVGYRVVVLAPPDVVR